VFELPPPTLILPNPPLMPVHFPAASFKVINASLFKNSHKIC
jgi:hypothetical protein